MKTFTGSPAEAARLQALDAKADGLPLAGTLVGQGPRKAIGGGPKDGDWFGWTRWRYGTDEATGKTYPVDAVLESNVSSAALTAPERTELAALVARAVPVAAEPLPVELGR